jgi:hypothetical protein
MVLEVGAVTAGGWGLSNACLRAIGLDGVDGAPSKESDDGTEALSG